MWQGVQTKKKMKTIDLNGFLQDEVFKNCFVCGNKKYCEFYFNESIYRVCAICLKKPDVMNFFGEIK